MTVQADKILKLTLSILVMTLMIKFLWNNALVPHITILKPVKDLGQAFLLALGLSIL